MTIAGKSYISGCWVVGESNRYQAVNPKTGQAFGTVFTSVSNSQMDEALTAAKLSALPYQTSSLRQRSEFLNTCAQTIMDIGDELLDIFCLESGYPKSRAEVERKRTCDQLQMFADYILTGEYLDARIDTAQPDRIPSAKPDIRSVNQALGPVVVFGASNFPLAYSVAGGDSASALAAGCPIIVKSHGSHPGTSELVAQAIVAAVDYCNMPMGIFNFINGNCNEVGKYLVESPVVKAVGFTGSFDGGMALYQIANKRSEPIPVFAEMGSINPIFLLQDNLMAQTQNIAQKFVASLILGSGQFCVNPGIVVSLKGDAFDRFSFFVGQALTEVPACVLLNQGISSAFELGTKEFNNMDGVELIHKGIVADSTLGFYAQAQIYKVSGKIFLDQPQLQEEIFGPVSLFVVCDDRAQMLKVAESIRGQLTASIHGTEQELKSYPELFSILTNRVGRLVVNGFPTGVEVTNGMVHGGPFPASTDARFTSVGTAAIKRFVRPVCYQNCPQSLLPEALQDNNPLNIYRAVNGRFSK